MSFYHDNAILNKQGGVSSMHKEVLLYAMRHKLCWLYAFFEFNSPNIISYQKLFSDNYYILTQGLSMNKFLVKNFFMNFFVKKIFYNVLDQKMFYTNIFWPKSIDRPGKLLRWI